jgi:hypothetical protein
MGGSVMILIDERINHQPVPLPNTPHPKTVGIKIYQAKRFTTMICLYNPPKIQLSSSTLHKLLTLPGEIIIGGDFNARRRFWSCAGSNSNEKTLFEFITTRSGYLN